MHRKKAVDFISKSTAFFGGPERDRTVDLRVANAALSQSEQLSLITFTNTARDEGLPFVQTIQPDAILKKNRVWFFFCQERLFAKLWNP
jgi:hypothetical protein